MSPCVSGTISGPRPHELRNRAGRRHVLRPPDWPGYGEKARQTSLEARAKIARGFGRSSFSLEAGYERLAGQKSISENTQQLIHAALRYGFAGGVVRLDVGADYYHDKIEGADAEIT